jgi:hypothetical protein
MSHGFTAGTENSQAQKGTETEGEMVEAEKEAGKK